MIPLVDALGAYEAGCLDTKEKLKLFAQLIRTGEARTFQGFYARSARHLIDAGYITPEGEITRAGRALVTADGGREGSPWDLNPRIGEAGEEPSPAPLAVPKVREDSAA